MSGHPPDAPGPDFAAPSAGHAHPGSADGSGSFGAPAAERQPYASGPRSVPGYPTARYAAGPYAGVPYPGQPYGGPAEVGQPYSGMRSGVGSAPGPTASAFSVRTGERRPDSEVERPAAIAVSMSMTITAALLWSAALVMAWIIAVASEPQFVSSDEFADTRIGLLINRFSARLLDGLAIPLLGFPVIAFVVAMLLPMRRFWPRWVYTGLGLMTTVWLSVWLGGDWLYGSPAMAYIAIAVGLMWMPAVSRWIGSSAPVGATSTPALGGTSSTSRRDAVPPR